MERFVDVCCSFAVAFVLQLMGRFGFLTFACVWIDLQKAVGSFLRYYEGFETRPVFSTVEEMLKWADLYGLTRRTLQEELADAGLSQRLISELVTVSAYCFFFGF